ncbi:MAG TPA: trehalose-6-phosphate synthase [Anaerolineales bacterium]|nr:trehalose-6-phosphate synthase [Anaerolineales bacterium]
MLIKDSQGPSQSIKNRREQCEQLQRELMAKRSLIIAANRAPVTFSHNEAGELTYERGGGGLVTALSGLAQNVDSTWIGSAITDADREWGGGLLPLDDSGAKLRIRFVDPPPDAYDAYYNVISNPLLWFLQHGMWNIARAPTITRQTWQAWEAGYVEVNGLFADAIADQINKSEESPLVMIQDYQLYLAPKMVRQRTMGERRYTLMHFTHIPWPGTEDLGILPPAMRTAILEGMLACDLVGFQTKEDALNFIRSCESHLSRVDVTFRKGRIWYKNHATYVRDFPISIDIDALRRVAASEEAEKYRLLFESQLAEMQLIVRIDRTEPSKNIVRGFQAFDEMLELYPEFCGKVQFLAMLVPSRMEVEQYQDYLDELMAAAGRVNAKHGGSEWEPVRVLVGENYARAVAALQLYDVLLVNSIADGMNLVAKEGPLVNRKNGVVILSERTGARQQLEVGSIVIPPCDVYATAEAIHQALIMPVDERQEMALRLRWTVEREDINDWLCRQLEFIAELNL